jgi:hypothetical protein
MDHIQPKCCPTLVCSWRPFVKYGLGERRSWFAALALRSHQLYSRRLSGILLTFRRA